MKKPKANQLSETVVFPSGELWEIVEHEYGGAIVQNPETHTYRYVDLDAAGCVIPVEPDSLQDQVNFQKLCRWDEGRTFSETLDDICKATGDKDWPYPGVVVMAVQQEMEDKRKLEAQNATMRKAINEFLDAWGMTRVDGRVTISTPPINDELASTYLFDLDDLGEDEEWAERGRKLKQLEDAALLGEKE